MSWNHVPAWVQWLTEGKDDKPSRFDGIRFILDAKWLQVVEWVKKMRQR